MFIINIISAPNPKKAVTYDEKNDNLVITAADVIALVEVPNPDNSNEVATVPMIMCCDSFGVYYPPQLDINFLEFIEQNDIVDIGKYTLLINEIKKFYKESVDTKVEVKNKGNVSFIKRLKKEDPKNDS